MNRPDGWEIRLRELIESARHKPFAWGSHDCATFAIEDYKAMTGEPPAFLFEWHDQQGAEAILAARSLEDMGRAMFGEPLEGWMAARRGDIALVSTTFAEPLHIAFGIVTGGTVAVPGAECLQFVPLRKVLKSWRVG